MSSWREGVFQIKRMDGCILLCFVFRGIEYLLIRTDQSVLGEGEIKNMNMFMKLITDDYKKQHYPDGYFKAAVKGPSSMTVWYILFSVALLFSLPCFILAIRGLIFNRDKLEMFDWSMTTVLCGIGIILVLMGSVAIRSGKKQRGKTAEDWIKEYANKSRYPENVIREFEHQFLTSEAYFLILTGKFDPLKEIILTADFIKQGPVILRLSDIKTACFFYQKEIGVGKQIPQSLCIGLISGEIKIRLYSKQDYGRGFLAMLKEKNPAIDTKEGTILTHDKFMSLV